MARQLTNAIRAHLTGVRLLIDAGLMRKSLILPILEQGAQIIGQVRRDTALYLPPEPKPKSRHPKCKYGQRVNAVLRDALLTQGLEPRLYGTVQRVQMRGVPVPAMWSDMHQHSGALSHPRLILAAETNPTVRDVVEIYSTR